MKLDSYKIKPKFFLPILGGYSQEHFTAAKKALNWKGRTIHIITGIIEALPVLGHIVSLFEASTFSYNHTEYNISIKGTVTFYFKKKESFEVEHQPHSPLKIIGDSGDIKVLQSNTKKVKIHTEKRSANKKRLEKIKIIFNRTQSGTLEIHTEYPKGTCLSSDSCDYKIEIPNTNGVDLQTKQGNIHINGLQGQAHLTTRKGNVIIESHKGNATINTRQGNVALQKHTGNSDTTTRQGNIKIQNHTGNAKAKTHQGNITIFKVKGKVGYETGTGGFSISGSSAEIVHYSTL